MGVHLRRRSDGIRNFKKKEPGREELLPSIEKRIGK
jgi:hypothetical protein